MDTENEPLLLKSPRHMSFVRRYCYGVGHVLNDLCASMWFTYLIVYFHKVLEFNNAAAGYIMLTGQVFDAICTPLIGYESDNTNGFCNYGKRKSWHLLGCVCVGFAFIFIFQPCIGCTDSTEVWAKFIYYTPFLFLSQFGWASVQISHLALIPELTSDAHERVGLNTIRYTFTVLSNIVVFVIIWLLLRFLHVPHDMMPVSGSTSLGPQDIPQFRYLAIIVVGLGSIFVLIFHLGTKEDKNSPTLHVNRDKLVSNSTRNSHRKMVWTDWLKCRQFYKVAGIYMCTRLMVNVSQVYIPLYVTESLKLSTDKVAIIPLVVYISGFIASSLFIKPLNTFLGRKMTYFLAAAVVIGACDWVLALHDERSENTGNEVYGIAILLGAGGSTALVTSLSMTADLINENTESGAFVYGAMSFTDKLSNGLAIMAIQLIHPCKIGCCAAYRLFYRDVMAFIPGGAAICSILILVTLIGTKLGEREHGDTQQLKSAEDNLTIQSYEDLEQTENHVEEELNHCSA